MVFNNHLHLEINLRLTVAGLPIELPGDSSEYNFDFSACHQKFVGLPQNSLTFESNSIHPLKFSLLPDSAGFELEKEKLIYRNEIFEVRREKNGSLVFTQPLQEPRSWIFIEPSFEDGKIVCDAKPVGKVVDYPLKYIDIVIFSNWLANYGDLLLHASGIIWEGEGYCFIGHSGVGKSTLVRDLREKHGLTVMGEDQIALRKLDDRLMVFGTPWHETQQMCDYGGVPLKKIFFLNREAKQVVSRVDGSAAVLRLLETAFYPLYRPEIIGGIMDRLIGLNDRVGFFELAYERGSDVLTEILKA